MNLLKKINTAVTQPVVEDAAGGATGAGGMAGGMAMPLFARLVQRSKPTDDSYDQDDEVPPPTPIVPAVKKNSIKEHYMRLREFADDAGGKAATPDQSFDSSGVMAKLKSLENKDSADHRDTVTFGLEDDNGGLVRVIVRHEQSEDFEKALQAMMAQEDDEDARPEIAEVLFKLKDRFDFVDVQWPEVEEDEEEPVDLQGADGENPDGAELDPNDPNALGDDMGVDDGGTAQVSDLLTQVIDMMKADAEARTADARAREAEAKNREAESIAKQASSRVKQEEQFLDMDMYNKSKKEEEKEAKRLAQLSKWKHEMGGQEGGDDMEFETTRKASLSAPEEEERSFRRPTPQRPQSGVKRVRGKLHPHDIANFIINRTRA